MTGLDVEKDTIISIACFITDSKLDLIDHGGCEAVIHHDKVTLDGMNQWCIRTHGASGLTAMSIASKTTPEEAAVLLHSYIRRLVPQPGKGLLAGNSVHMDKAFLSKPPYNIIVDHLHYRIFDVSSIKEAARRWANEEALMQVPKKQLLHQAKEDILESIEEAKFYQRAFFVGERA